MPKNSVGPPKNHADYSSNWKKLKDTLVSKPKKRKAEQSNHRHKRRKLGDGEGEASEKKHTKDVSGLHRAKTGDSASVLNGKETKKTAEKNEIWFDDVDEILLERPSSSQHGDDKHPLMFKNAVTHATKALAMDCEMVGVGKDGQESVLARVSLVNQHGHCIYDKFVKPREKVTDYRTHVSGVRPHDLRHAEDFLVVQKEVSDLLKGKMLVGHALQNDLKVLFLSHPKKHIRDTSRYKPFIQVCGGRRPALKKLSAKLLGVSVQQGEHSSVQDAQAAMRLYITHRKKWERELFGRHKEKEETKPTKKKAETNKTVAIADSVV